jgi:hypothetical protein
MAEQTIENAVNKVLKHYGVRGMRWGIRRSDTSASVNITSPKTGDKVPVKFDSRKVSVNPVTRTVTGSNKRAVKAAQAEVDRATLLLKRKETMSDDFRMAFAARQKHPSELNNTEMRALVERLDLEQRYGQALARQITLVPKPPPTKIQQSRKFAGNLLKDIAQNEVKRVAKGVVQQTVNKEAKKRGLQLGGEGKKKNKGN